MIIGLWGFNQVYNKRITYCIWEPVPIPVAIVEYYYSTWREADFTSGFMDFRFHSAWVLEFRKQSPFPMALCSDFYPVRRGRDYIQDGSLRVAYLVLREFRTRFRVFGSGNFQLHVGWLDFDDGRRDVFRTPNQRKPWRARSIGNCFIYLPKSCWLRTSIVRFRRKYYYRFVLSERLTVQPSWSS